MAKLSARAQEFYKARIGNIQVVFLIIIFGPLYALQFILDATIALSIIAAFIGFVATSGLVLYFKFKGAYIGKKNAGYKLLITLVGFLIEVIPELDLIPGDLLEFGVMFLISRVEDHDVAQEKADETARIAKEQQKKAIQYAQYAQRKQAQQQLQEQVEEEDAEVAEAYRAQTRREQIEAEDQEVLEGYRSSTYNNKGRLEESGEDEFEPAEAF